MHCLLVIVAVTAVEGGAYGAGTAAGGDGAGQAAGNHGADAADGRHDRGGRDAGVCIDPAGPPSRQFCSSCLTPCDPAHLVGEAVAGMLPGLCSTGHCYEALSKCWLMPSVNMRSRPHECRCGTPAMCCCPHERSSPAGCFPQAAMDTRVGAYFEDCHVCSCKSMLPYSSGCVLFR